MPIKGRRCFTPISPSRWVARIYLTCDNMIAVEYRHGQHVKKVLPHGPGAYLGYGGVPAVCCLYPGTQGELAETLYELAQTWSYGGEWVHQFLYKKFGYQLVAPPEICGGCNTSCSLTSSKDPANVGNTVAFTATITNTDGGPHGDAPEGSVDWYVDGVWTATTPLLEDEPDSKNRQTSSWTWTCASSGDHTIEAVYRPSAGDWAPTRCSLQQSCGPYCCPNTVLPQTLYATISNVSGCECFAGTTAVDWDATAQAWIGQHGDSCTLGSQQIELACMTNSQGDAQFVLNFDTLNQLVWLQTISCSPLQLVAQNVPIDDAGAFCSGTVNITVTA